MFKFITKIFSNDWILATDTQNESYVETLLEGFQAAVFKTQSDFKTMEYEFNKTFDNLLNVYKTTIDDIYLKVERPIALENALRSTFLEETIRTIFFKYFLRFYDEYSYSINVEIMDLHTTKFNLVRAELKYEPNAKYLLKSTRGGLKDYENIKYFNFEYFFRGLEEKVSSVFRIETPIFRTILYGNIYPMTELRTKKIIDFYQIILYYKIYGFNVDIEGCTGFIRPFKDNRNGEYTIHIMISKYSSLLLLGIHELHEYHTNILKKCHVSKTRFIHYADLCEKAKSSLSLESNQDLLDISPIDMEFDNPKYFRAHVFEHLVYLSNVNDYSFLLNEIKKLLVSFSREAESTQLNLTI